MFSEGKWLVALGCCAACAAPPPSAPMTAAPPKAVVVYDPIAKPTDPHVEELLRLPQADRKHILDLVFGPGHYHTNVDQCRFDGDITPTIAAVAWGSFTAARTKQALYIIQTGECGASHAENYGTSTFAVLENGDLLAVYREAGSASVDGVFDLDADGRSEILVTFGFTNQGITVQHARLERVRAGKLEVFRDFGEVYSDDCGGISEPKRRNYTVVRAIGGDFETAQRSALCP